LPQAGEDVIKAYCDGDTTLTLQNLPSESADQGGHFYDENFNNITKLGPISPPYDGTLYYQTSNGICFDTAQINLTVRPNPTINEIADISLCSNDIYTSNIILQNGQTMTWSDGNTDPIRNISQAGSYSYQITDDFGCTVSDTFTIIKLPPAKSRTTDAQICDGDSYIFMNNEYRIPGIYTDTIKSKIGCDSVFFNLNLNLYPYSPITIADDLDFCEGHHTDIVISSSHDTILLDGIKTLTPLTFTEGGTYMITGTDQNGCTSEKEITITVHPNPQVNTIDMIDTVFSSGLSFPVTYDGDIEAYHWSPSTSLDCNDCPYPTLLYPQAGIYTIAIEDNNGCKNEAQLKVSFLEKKLFLPNIISNNATDPENGYFYVKGNNTSLYTMSVYDRWGNLVFYTKDAQVNQRDQGWHPQAKVVSGVYVYLVRYVENGVEKIEYGNVTVLD
jgi:hypothetical protein